MRSRAGLGLFELEAGDFLLNPRRTQFLALLAVDVLRVFQFRLRDRVAGGRLACPSQLGFGERLGGRASSSIGSIFLSVASAALTGLGLGDGRGRRANRDRAAR